MKTRKQAVPQASEGGTMKEAIASWLFDNGPVRAAVCSSILFLAAVAAVVLVVITAPAVLVISVWAAFMLFMGAKWGLSNREIRQARREFQRKYGT